MALGRAAVASALKRLAAAQNGSFSTLTSRSLGSASQGEPILEAGLLNAARASVSLSSRGFAAEPAEAPAEGLSKGYVKSVSSSESSMAGRFFAGRCPKCVFLGIEGNFRSMCMDCARYLAAYLISAWATTASFCRTSPRST